VNRLYHRLNDDYSPMHGLCRFILEQTGPSIHPGDRTFIPFELDMRKLFESFVAEWLHANAPPGMTVRCQHNATLDSNLEMRIHIDIVLCEEHSQRPIAVLDTKYKATEQPSEGELWVGHAMLVYPSMLTSPLRMLHGKNILLESLVFDIAASLDVAGAAFLNALNARLADPGTMP
jgi:5-methylcytosine-specific restriction enzyme subunit McrC